MAWSFSRIVLMNCEETYFIETLKVIFKVRIGKFSHISLYWLVVLKCWSNISACSFSNVRNQIIKWMTKKFKSHYASLQWNRNSVDPSRPMGLLFISNVGVGCNVFLTFYAISNISRFFFFRETILFHLMFSSCFFMLDLFKQKYSTYLFQILYEGRYPLRYFARVSNIEIWYPPMTRTTAFAAKWHSYPPNLQNAISP